MEKGSEKPLSNKYYREKDLKSQCYRMGKEAEDNMILGTSLKLNVVLYFSSNLFLKLVNLLCQYKIYTR